MKAVLREERGHGMVGTSSSRAFPSLRTLLSSLNLSSFPPFSPSFPPTLNSIQLTPPPAVPIRPPPQTPIQRPLLHQPPPPRIPLLGRRRRLSPKTAAPQPQPTPDTTPASPPPHGRRPRPRPGDDNGHDKSRRGGVSRWTQRWNGSGSGSGWSGAAAGTRAWAELYRAGARGGEKERGDDAAATAAAVDDGAAGGGGGCAVWGVYEWTADEGGEGE